MAAPAVPAEPVRPGDHADAGDSEAVARWQAQVWAAELAFARSMAERDLAAFEQALSEHAVFFTGAGNALRGKAAVVAGWRAYFDGDQAPFAWQPQWVEVLADGQLAHSSGPVRDPAGRAVAQFNSVWRQEAPGVWRVVFDKGSPLPGPAPDAPEELDGPDGPDGPDQP